MIESALLLGKNVEIVLVQIIHCSINMIGYDCTLYDVIMRRCGFTHSYKEHEPHTRGYTWILEAHTTCGYTLI